MRSILWAIAAAALVVGGFNSASAEAAGAKRAAKAPYTKSAKAAPRAKRYFYRNAYKTCGQYKYWKGGKCLDARTNPPSLK
jgi:hypothetical protein